MIVKSLINITKKGNKTNILLLILLFSQFGKFEVHIILKRSKYSFPLALQIGISVMVA